MPERDQDKHIDISFERASDGGYYVLDHNTHWVIASIPKRGGFSGSEKALNLLRGLAGEKPIDQYVREQVEGK
ncbi:hypothetical protein A2696_01840 [Candidatus Curtissbacteria bacterium RIFCSPHIGHO2_01_FULL_41_13]|uniref:Uncharacterized protein n=1 Tax=Candidatus Curtissbacteria bacterium RIFCSPHIGHO2_01_FULL_41_13 TaxID=1797745 RepID=A0A1F5G1H7_9BACT|nr:MAG: hypothetical protein A2696_01840 [Candidatus Curtissbacteria bacterium RIFCSPHIGHO2_01_FULL_41_13]